MHAIPPTPAPPSPVDPAEAGWRLATRALIGLTLVNEALLRATDGRVPRDYGRYYVDLPDVYWDLGSIWTIPEALGTAFARTSGWFDLLVAFLLRALGRSPLPFELIGVAFLGLLIGSVAVVARRLAGPVAATAAVAFTASYPVVTLFSRKDWIHVPEAALLFAALAVWLGDETFSRRRTAPLVGGLLAAILLLRQTGLIWAATFAVAAGPAAWRAGRGKVAVLAAFLAFGAAPSIPGLATYLSRKVAARERYGADIPPLWEQISPLLGQVPILLTIAGLACALPFLRRRWSRGPMLLGSWALLPFPLYYLFLAGIDNFNAFAPALAIGAAWGLSAIDRRLVAAPALGLLVFLGPQWLPAGGATFLGPLAPEDSRVESMEIAYRHTTPWPASRIAALLDATCPSEEWRSCRIVVDQGLFAPAVEEFGLLELFLMGEDRVELRTVYDEPDGGWESAGVDGMMLFECSWRDEQWRKRLPDLAVRTIEIVQATGLAESWRDRPTIDCSVHWLTPWGSFAYPEKAPLARNPESAPFWTLERAWGAHMAFLQRNPVLANARGRISVVDDDRTVATDQPAGWTTDLARRARARSARFLGADPRP